MQKSIWASMYVLCSLPAECLNYIILLNGLKDFRWVGLDQILFFTVELGVLVLPTTITH